MSDTWELPLECWVIRGTLSNGSPFYSRRWDEKNTKLSALFMNAQGAKVEVVRQTREPNAIVWSDTPASPRGGGAERENRSQPLNGGSEH